MPRWGGGGGGVGCHSNTNRIGCSPYLCEEKQAVLIPFRVLSLKRSTARAFAVSLKLIFVHEFRGEKNENPALVKNNLFSQEIEFGTYINLYSF